MSRDRSFVQASEQSRPCLSGVRRFSLVLLFVRLGNDVIIDAMMHLVGTCGFFLSRRRDQQFRVLMDPIQTRLCPAI